MDKTIEKLTVFFENPFWVGIFERISDGKLYVCKVTFGSEPINLIKRMYYYEDAKTSINNNL